MTIIVYTQKLHIFHPVKKAVKEDSALGKNIPL